MAGGPESEGSGESGGLRLRAGGGSDEGGATAREEGGRAEGVQHVGLVGGDARGEASTFAAARARAAC